jgi:phage FluMu protein Com
LSLKHLLKITGSVTATYRQPHDTIQVLIARLHQLSFEDTFIKHIEIRGSTGYIKIIRTTVKAMRIHDCNDLTIEIENSNIIYLKIQNCKDISFKQSQGSYGEVKIYSKGSSNLTVYFERGIFNMFI